MDPLDDYVEKPMLEAETVVEETILEEIPVELEPIETGPPLTSALIGPEKAIYKNVLMVFRSFYRGQYSVANVKTWTVRSNTLEEFLDYLYELARPYMKRAVEFRSGEPFWSEKEVPTRKDLPLYVTFKDRIQKRVWRAEQLEGNMLLKWGRKTITLRLFVHSIRIQSRAEWETVKLKLFEGKTEVSSNEKRTEQDMAEEQKLQALVERLRKIHHDKLAPMMEDAFHGWARLILLQPTQAQADLCYGEPPDSLKQNFVEVNKNENRKRIRVSGPAQREHVADGFGFEDEVQALRQTVTQIKDLVEMLDRRVGLLEEKCHGYKQTVVGIWPTNNPTRFEANENKNDGDEALIDIVLSEDATDGVQGEGSGNSDPLILVGMGQHVKQEMECEDD
ncbi:uncharacterized protein LOC129775740 [Toxorhynchites rutilus septentrionalis]|uniref:uncharacterized protein LOC129775740 n=1 Tax=Toxorhynchites rutilus septentrionalis TaxID=329112 RepID=UPI00247B0692|nr:uncharacterized protein LOC129775740 [Toxorhynchites rutilus septentrionalis]